MHRRDVLRGALLAPAALASACAPLQQAPTVEAPPTVAATQSTYKVDANDQIKVSVFRHDDLSGQFQLDGAGNFSMPLIGEIQARGLTTTELEHVIEAKLQDGYLVDPQVQIEVLTYRPFYILGEVRNPGSYPYVNGMTVLTAVALAGGFTYRADQDDIILKRGGANSAPMQATGDTPMLPGDVIEVTERFF
ncbi:MAG: polysaccharide biosynthesis/export family protein [Geminicoccaceae bacterium]